MDNGNPLVSVIIPAFNACDFIVETINSVINQTWNNTEIIVVNDGSTDCTLEIVQSLSYPVAIIDQENRGLGAARNAGIARAKGAFLAFLDADDLWHPKFIETQVDGLTQKPEVGVLYSWWSYIDGKGCTLPEIGLYQGKGNILPDLVLSNRFPVMTALVRREWIDRIQGFNEDRLISEDWDFWLRLANATCLFDYSPCTYSMYRFHGSNMTLKVANAHKRYEKVLENFFTYTNHAQSIMSLKKQAYSQVYLVSTLGYLHLRANEEANKMFLAGVKIWPELLLQRDTYYKLICAFQPPGYRNTRYYKDLRLSETVVENLFEYIKNNSENKSETEQLLNQAEIVKSLVFAEHYYLDRQENSARVSLRRAWVKNPFLISNWNFLKLLAKAILGRQRITNLQSIFHIQKKQIV